MPNCTPIGATCRLCAAKKTQNRPLSNLNNRRFALLAMLPVNEHTNRKDDEDTLAEYKANRQ